MNLDRHSRNIIRWKRSFRIIYRVGLPFINVYLYVYVYITSSGWIFFFQVRNELTICRSDPGEYLLYPVEVSRVLP